MRTTRRWQTIAALGGVLLALGLLTGRHLPLLGGFGVGAFLLAAQVAAVRSFATASDGLSVSVESRQHVLVDEDVVVTLRTDLDEPIEVRQRVEAATPVTARDTEEDALTLGLGVNETTGTTTTSVSFPVAGEFSFPPATVRLTDRRELFTESISVDVDESVVVEPRRPHDVHVGRGGERKNAAYGEHPTGITGGGLIPDELREYVTSDSAANIDWKATARLGEPYVREFEAETDRRTALVVDHRASMETGVEGQTMLDYARQFALGVVSSAEQYSDAIGLYTVGDGGTTVERSPQSDPRSYALLRSELRSLAATTRDGDVSQTTSVTTPERAARLSAELGDDTQFSRTLRPYFEATDVYTRRIEADPLNTTVRRVRRRTSDRLWTIVVTDDTDRKRVRESVKYAASNGGRAVVCLTPRVLFERGGMADLEAAYERYLDFEEFRRDLERLPRVTAFELGPGDRVEALLAARRRERLHR